MGELNVVREGFGDLLDAIETEQNSDESIVKELVASFLLPQVQRQKIQHQGTTSFIDSAFSNTEDETNLWRVHDVQCPKKSWSL